MSSVGATGYTTNLKQLDYLIDLDGSTYIAIDQDGVIREDDSDFGAVFNNTLTRMSHEGILGIRGGNTYVPTTQPLVQGTGSYLEKQIEIVGVGGGPWPIIDAPTGIHCIQVQGGANLYLHKLEFIPHTSGSGRAVYGPESAGNAYDENSVWWGRFADLKMEGGTSGQYLFELELPEWFTLEGRISIDGGTGVHGMKLSCSATSQFSYVESVSTALLTISTTGANTTCLALEGNSAGHLVNLMDWYGRQWLRNDSGSAGTIGLKCDYVRQSHIRGIHFENVEYGIQQNTGTQNVRFEGGNSYCTLNANTGAFFDMNAGYNCTIANFVCWFGGANRPIIDDENDDANSPHKYEGLIYYGSGGSPVDDLGANAMTETYPNGKYYRRLGTAGAWP